MDTLNFDDVMPLWDDKSDETPVDMVNHPPHYEREGAMECFEEMRMIFGDYVVMHFCQCNAWKYRYRAVAKNGAEDMAKSDWYISKYKELKEELDRKNRYPRVRYSTYRGNGDWRNQDE